jgi:VCBS repeat-containing protein
MPQFSTSIASFCRQFCSTFFAKAPGIPDASAVNQRPAHLLALEPRVLFSGAPIDASVDLDAAMQSSDDLFVAFDDAATHDDLISRLILVDSTIDDIQSLISEVQDEFGTAASVIQFSSQESSLADLTALLSQYDEVDEVHVFTHGSDGSLVLGQEHFDTSALLRESELVAALRATLSDDGRVMLYGCNVAATENGQQFISLFAQLTDAEVYASTDITGAGDLGGDWALEFSTNGQPGLETFTELTWQGTLPEIDAGSTIYEKRTHVSGSGAAQAVAMHSDGSFVGVYSSKADGSGWGIFAQRYAADGTPVGPEMQVSETTALNQHWASIGMADNGDFVITWTNDGTTQDVYARRYAANDTPLTSEFRVNTTVTGAQRNSTISMHDDGSFIIAWEGNGGGDSYGIYLQCFDSSGIATGGQTLVNTATTGNQEHATLSINDSGAFLVAWEDTTGIHAQRFSAAGAKVGGTVDISNDDAAGRTSVLLFDDDRYATAYSVPVFGIEQVVLKTYSSSNTQTSAWSVNIFSTTNLGNPSLVGTGSGDFVLTWEGYTAGGDMDVFYQTFNSSGFATSIVKQINSYTAGDQKMVSGSMLSTNQMVFAFSGAGPTTATGVYFRTYSTTPVVPNSPPTAVDDNLGRINGTIEIDYSTLESNDTDLEGDGIKVIDFSRPTNGVLWDQKNDDIRYLPNMGYAGPDSFQYKIADNDLGIKHYWDLDNQGYDLPGGKDATANGTTVGPGNKGLWFDADNQDYLEVEDFGYSSSFTLDFEFYVDDLSGNDFRYMYSHGDPGTGVQIYLNESNDMLSTIVRDSNDALAANELDIDASGLVGGWHRYTLVVQQGVGSSIYVDGMLQRSTTKGDGGVNPNGHLFIGSRSDESNSQFMHGAIGDIVLFERALSVPDVASLGATYDQLTATVSLVVNGPPVANSETFATDQNTNVAGTVAGNDSDPTGDSLTYVLQTGPTRGLFSFQADGTFSYDLNGEFDYLPLGAIATEVVTYEVRDGFGGSAIATATFTINGLNDLPIEIVSGATVDITMDEDDVHNGSGLLGNFFDIDGGMLQVSPVLVDAPDNGSLVLNPDGTFTYTPNSNFYGTDQFVYRVEDQNGGFIDGVVNFTINDVIDHPVFTGTPNFQIFENTTAVGMVTATHSENRTITFALVGSGPDDANFSLDPSTGRLQFLTPPAYQPFGDADNDGIYQILVRATTTGGGLASQLYNVRVLNGINAPVFPSISPYFLNENTSPLFQLPAATDADNDVITYSLQSNADASNFIFNPLNRRFVFVGVPDYESPTDRNRDNTYELNFVATDSSGRSTIASVQVVVNDFNELPVMTTAYRFSYAEHRNSSLRVEFSDPERQRLTYSLVNLLDGGAFEINSNNGNLRFVTPPDYEAFGDLNRDNTYQVVVRAFDGVNSVDELIEVDVTNVLEQAILRNDSLTINQGASHTSLIRGVLRNDEFFDSGSKTLQVASGPAHGNLVLLPDGTYSYQHNGTRLPADSFTYRVIESSGAVSTATVNISVLMNPLALGGDATIVSVGSERFSFAELVRNESGGSNITMVIISPPAFGTIITNPDGSITFNPQDQSGITSFQYQAIVDGRVSNVATVDLTVTGITAPAMSSGTEKEVKKSQVPIVPSHTASTTTADSLAFSDPANNADDENSDDKLVGMVPRTDAANVIAPKSQTIQSNTRTLSYSNRMGFQSFDLREYVAAGEVGNDSNRDRLEWLNSAYKPLSENTQEWFAQVESQAAMTASAAAGLISLGYLTWMIRGGVLLTTFASSLPTWQSFDPLPVVTRMDRSDENDEGIDEMVEAQKS